MFDICLWQKGETKKLSGNLFPIKNISWDFSVHSMYSTDKRIHKVEHIIFHIIILQRLASLVSDFLGSLIE